MDTGGHDMGTSTANRSLRRCSKLYVCHHSIIRSHRVVCNGRRRKCETEERAKASQMELFHKFYTWNGTNANQFIKSMNKLNYNNNNNTNRLLCVPVCVCTGELAISLSSNSTSIIHSSTVDLGRV